MTQSVRLPAALIVGHPGHELRLFRWLRQAHPLVCVLTDGSGSGRTRISSSLDLLRDTASTAGPVMGAFTDVQMYELMLNGDIAPVVATIESIASALVEQRIASVVADAFELYNPTHDLASVVAALATARAEAVLGTSLQRYDYAVTVAASGEGIVLDLSADDVEQKLAAAYAFENLTNDVDAILAVVGRQDVAREILRPLTSGLELPVPLTKPYYEVHGEKRVASGRYRTVLRYEGHFIPFVQALAAAVGTELGMRRPVALR